MVLLEAAAVVALVGLIIYGTITVLTGNLDRPRPVRGGHGRWRVAHYESDGTTRIVVQKISAEDDAIVDEHVVDTVPEGDPDYDAKFLAGMSRARERLALFEAEEG